MRQRRYALKYIRKELPAFHRNKKEYLSQTDKKEVHRFFITSGNFQLINSLAIIEQLKETDELPAVNHILVWSITKSETFSQLNENIARSFGIQHYHSCYGPEWDVHQIVSYLIEKQMYSMDEVYSLQLEGNIKIYEALYQGCKHIITDESYFTLVPPPKKMATQCRKFITTCYLNKLDYVDFPGRPWKVEYLQREFFDYVARRCVEMYPWPNVAAPNSKDIVFCATYDAIWDTQIAERQKYIIQRLIEKGFRILYKPHPRDTELPEESEHLKLLHTRLPLECYRLEGILAVVSIYSSASTQTYHYNRVAGFIDYASLYDKVPEYIDILSQQYTPSVELLFGIDAREKDGEELKKIIDDIYKAHLADKPLMSENKLFLQSFQDALKK